jgi:hypothetical protein
MRFLSSFSQLLPHTSVTLTALESVHRNSYVLLCAVVAAHMPGNILFKCTTYIQKEFV